MTLKHFGAVIGTLVAVLSCMGCRTFTNPGEVSKVYSSESAAKHIYRISWDATRRGTYVLADESGIRVVSEPPPDAALEAITDLSAKLGASGGAITSADGQAKVTETIKALERAIEISYLREVLFRINEAYFNGAITPEQYYETLRAVNKNTAIIITIKDLDKDELQILLTYGFFGDGINIQAFLKTIVKTYDIDSDGNLSQSETRQLIEDIESGKVEQNPDVKESLPPSSGRAGGGGGGRISAP